MTPVTVIYPDADCGVPATYVWPGERSEADGSEHCPLCDVSLNRHRRMAAGHPAYANTVVDTGAHDGLLAVELGPGDPSNPNGPGPWLEFVPWQCVLQAMATGALGVQFGSDDYGPAGRHAQP